jgi:RNA polymerase sigma-70 factor (ECF subfamily)
MPDRHGELRRRCAMPAPRSRAGWTAAEGLRRLADLVRAALVPEPLPALAGGSWMSSEAHAVRPSPHSGGSAGRAHLELRESGSEAVHPMEDEHSDVWRLVEAAQGGDGEAFGKIYDLYVDTVYRFVYFRVNDRGLAEDFTSETFLRALRRIGSITYQGRDIGAWLVTIARNIIFDHSKSARHRLEVTTGDIFESNELAPSPESSVLDSLTSDTLIAGIKQLNAEQRECVVLRFVQGLSVAETAAAMGKNDGAIKALQHRAVRKLGDLVGGELR